jgi:hypothetical protein
MAAALGPRRSPHAKKPPGLPGGFDLGSGGNRGLLDSSGALCYTTPACGPTRKRGLGA